MEQVTGYAIEILIGVEGDVGHYSAHRTDHGHGPGCRIDGAEPAREITHPQDGRSRGAAPHHQRNCQEQTRHWQEQESDARATPSTSISTSTSTSTHRHAPSFRLPAVSRECAGGRSQRENGQKTSGFPLPVVETPRIGSKKPQSERRKIFKASRASRIRPGAKRSRGPSHALERVPWRVPDKVGEPPARAFRSISLGTGNAGPKTPRIGPWEGSLRYAPSGIPGRPPKIRRNHEVPMPTPEPRWKNGQLGYPPGQRAFEHGGHRAFGKKAISE